MRFADLAQRPITIERDPETGEDVVSIPEVCGEFWWATLHSWAHNVHDHGCSHCGEFAISAARAMHDTVNVQLGRPVLHPQDLREVAEAMAAAVAMGSHAVIAELGQEPGPGLSGVIPQAFQGFKVQTKLVRSRGKAPEPLQITQPSDLQPIFTRMRGADREFLLAIFVDTKNRVTAVEEVNVGDRSASIVDNAAIFRSAILLNASGVFLAHNHPSGDPTPSDADRRLFDALRNECAGPLNIRVLDMIIVGAFEDFSISQNARMSVPEELQPVGEARMADLVQPALFESLATAFPRKRVAA